MSKDEMSCYSGHQLLIDKDPVLDPHSKKKWIRIHVMNISLRFTYLFRVYKEIFDNLFLQHIRLGY